MTAFEKIDILWMSKDVWIRKPENNNSRLTECPGHMRQEIIHSDPGVAAVQQSADLLERKIVDAFDSGKAWLP
jgi:hypothetical protein